MKTCIKTIMVAALAAFFLSPVVIRAQDDGSGDNQGVSFQTFYDQLGSQGTWIQTDDYGYVWQPPVTDPNWSPYSAGHWVYTDNGWFWVSDEPWGWATYHYGRWANIDGTGWVWVPGYRWAPAWVSWRYGGGYAGWAPLPPETLDEGSGIIAAIFGFHFGGDADVSFNIGPGCYNFVPADQLGAPDCRRVIIDRNRNYVVINQTTNITDISLNRSGVQFGGVLVKGPSLAEVNAHAKYNVATVKLTAASQPGSATLHGSTLAVFAPRVNPATQHQARPASVARTINHPSFNRGVTITKPLAVTAKVQPPAPSEAAVQAAQQAQLHSSAQAKIATEKTPVKHTPLTSLAPSAPPPSHQEQPKTTVQPEKPSGGEPPPIHPQPPSLPPSVHPAPPPSEVNHPSPPPAPPEVHLAPPPQGIHPSPLPAPGAVHPAPPPQNGGKPADQNKKDDDKKQPPGQ